MITLLFQIPVGKVHTIKVFAQYIKHHYNTQTAYHSETNILEVKVAQNFKSNVINVALAYDYLFLGGG